MSAQNEIALDVFSGGVNKRLAPALLEDSELAECINFNVEPGSGSLVARYGFNTLEDGTDFGAVDVMVLGLFRTSAFSRLVVSTGSKVFYSNDGDTWTEVTLAGPTSISNVVYAVQYTDNFYLIRNNSTIVSWNGTTATAIAGSPQGEVAIVHKERLWVVDSTSTTIPSRLFYSNIGDPTTWGGSDFIDIRPGDGDVVTALAVYQDVLFIFKLFSTWGLSALGDPVDWTLRLLSPSIGCTSKWTPREIEGALYFIGVRGVYITDGNSFREISEKVEPVFRNRLIDLTDINSDSAAWWNDRYICHINRIETAETWALWGTDTWESKEGTPWSGQVAAQDYWVWHIRSQAWTQWDFPDGMTPFTFVDIRVEIPSRGLYAGSNGDNGRVYIQANDRFVDSLPSGDVDISCTLRTKRFDYGIASRFKRLKWSSLHVFGAGNITLQYIINNQAQTAVTKVATQSDAVYKFAGPGKFHSVQFLVGIESDEESKLYSLVAHLHGQRTVIKSGKHG